MATLTITIPNAQLTRVANAVATQHGYQAEVPDPDNPGQTIPNPQTKADFAREVLMRFLRETVRAHEAAVAAESARQTAITKADSEVTIS